MSSYCLILCAVGSVKLKLLSLEIAEVPVFHVYTQHVHAIVLLKDHGKMFILILFLLLVARHRDTCFLNALSDLTGNVAFKI